MRNILPVEHIIYDHESSGTTSDRAFNLPEMESLFSKRKIEVAPQLEWFDSMWRRLSENLQEPVQNEGVERFSGYTGHRNVILAGRMGRCALGFHLLRVGGDDYRNITAYRRKIYSDGRRRRYYTSDSMYISSSEIISYSFSPRLEHQMGVMEAWIDAYEGTENPDN